MGEVRAQSANGGETGRARASVISAQELPSEFSLASINCHGLFLLCRSSARFNVEQLTPYPASSLDHEAVDRSRKALRANEEKEEEKACVQVFSLSLSVPALSLFSKRRPRKPRLFQPPLALSLVLSPPDPLISSTSLSRTTGAPRKSPSPAGKGSTLV